MLWFHSYFSISVHLWYQVSIQVAGSLTDVVVDTQRRKHLAYLMADHGTIVNPEASRNLPKQVQSIRYLLHTLTCNNQHTLKLSGSD